MSPCDALMTSAYLLLGNPCPYILVLEPQLIMQGMSVGASMLTILTWRLLVIQSTYCDILPQTPWHALALSLPGYNLLLKVYKNIINSWNVQGYKQKHLKHFKATVQKSIFKLILKSKNQINQFFLWHHKLLTESCSFQQFKLILSESLT